MTAGLYMDVHVPSAITEGLRRRGVSVLTSQEDGKRRASDNDLLSRATELNRIVFSQDEDFLELAPRWRSLGKSFTGIAFAPQQGSSIGRLIDDLELVVHCARDDELRDRVTYLPLR